MDRKKALMILGLRDEATIAEIQKRTGVLCKKFRQIDKDENGSTLADVEHAYRFLSGIEYYDKEAEQKKEKRQKHPNVIFRLLKIDEDKARNNIYYYKWPVLITAAVIFIVISMIVSIATREKPDLRIIVAGEIFINDVSVFEERIESEVDGITAAVVQNILLAKDDSKADAAMLQKYVVEIAAGQNDVYILDEIQYKKLAEQGGTVPIEEVLGDLNELDIDTSTIEELKLAIIEDEGEAPNKPLLYGIDVSESKLLPDSGVEADRMIACFGLKGKFGENAVAFVRALME